MKKKMNRIGRFLSVFFVALFFVSLTTVNATQVRTGYYNRSYTLGNNQADNIVAVAQAQMGKTKAQLNYDNSYAAQTGDEVAGYIINGDGDKYEFTYSNENEFKWMYGSIFVCGNELYYWRRFVDHVGPSSTRYIEYVWQVGE